MIINNTTSFRGIFKYDESASYEKDDFVIDNNCIYICTAANPTSINNEKRVVSGISPSGKDSKSRENFIPYLGDQIVSIDEYKNYIKDRLNNKTVEDKYISAAVLDQVLQNMSFGITDSGIIKSYSDLFTDLDESTNVLDNILNDPNLNNGILTLDRDLPEIKSLFFYDIKEAIKHLKEDEIGYEDSLDYYYTDSSKVVILKQYTYSVGTGDGLVMWRLQELIDPVTGETYYRSSEGTKQDEVWKFNTKTTFFSNLSGCNFSLVEKLKALELFKQQELNDINNLKESLKNSFRFKDCDIVPNSEITIRKIVNNVSMGNLFTVLVRIIEADGISRNVSTTINIDELVSTYRLTDKVSLTVTTSPSSIKFIVPEGSIISNIYYRVKYE